MSNTELRKIVLVRKGAGAAIGDDFETAMAVATGREKFRNLDRDATFHTTRDGSHAGSHAFATDLDAVLDAWNLRMSGAQSIAAGSSDRLQGRGDGERILYNDFDAGDAVRMLTDDFFF